MEKIIATIKSIFDSIFKKFDEVGFKGLKGYIFLIGAIVLFISPMLVFSFTFGRKLYVGLFDYEKIVLNVILNTILFIILYILGSIRQVNSIDEDNNKEDEENNKEKNGFNVFCTLLLMGMISGFIFISYLIYKQFTESIEVKIGISLLFLFLLSIIAYYFSQWLILIKELNKDCKDFREIQAKKKKEEKEKEKNKDEDDEMEDMEEL